MTKHQLQSLLTYRSTRMIQTRIWESQRMWSCQKHYLEPCRKEIIPTDSPHARNGLEKCRKVTNKQSAIEKGKQIHTSRRTIKAYP
jgi:hypothetical protein